MRKSFVIEIKKGGKIVANLNKEVVCTEMLSFVMVWVEAILLNFNLHLSSSKLEDIPLAVRILQEEDAEASLEMNRAVIYQDTLDYLDVNYPKFNIYAPLDWEVYISSNDGMLAAIESDIINNRKFADMQIVIDFDKSCVNFKYNFKKVKLVDWEDKKAGKLKENLQVCPYNFKALPFNDLVDAYSFVLDNEDGWLESKRGRTVTVFS